MTAYESSKSPQPKYASGKGSKNTISIVVLDTEDPDAAVEAAKAETETQITQDGKTLVRTDLTPKRTSDRSWLVDVEYAEEDNDEKTNEPGEPGTWRFDFDGQNGTQEIKQAQETSSYSWSMSEEPPDFNGAIGWDGNEVRGCEIVVPSFEFSITAFYDPTEITVSRCLHWASLRGKTNADGWLGQSPGEFLYLGPRGSGDIPTVAGQRVKPIEINHRFAYSPNQTDLQIGSITVEAKKGWEYLWVVYRKEIEGTEVLPKPAFAFVEKVYDELIFGISFAEIAGSDP